MGQYTECLVYRSDLDRKEKVKTTIYIVFSIRVIVGPASRRFTRPFFQSRRCNIQYSTISRSR